MFTLEGKTYIVTGASRGIGNATANILLDLGANVVGGYSSSPGQLKGLWAQYGDDRLLPLQMDLSEPGAAFKMWEQALAFKGQIDGIVNNAGIAPSTPYNAPIDQWQSDWAQVMQVNVQAVADLCKAAIEYFEAERAKDGEFTGRIVTVASRAAFRGDQPDSLHYAASKGALVALMRSIARGFAGKGIYAFSIAPGWVDTGMAEITKLPGNEHMLKEIPMGAVAPPENIGNMIAFLMSGLVDHATGTTIDINGASYVR